MEEVEEANKAAVESCHRVLSILSQPQDQIQYRNLMVETGEAVFKFKKVVSLLSGGGGSGSGGDGGGRSGGGGCGGHGRVRKLKKFLSPQSPLPSNIFLENPNSKTDASSTKPLQLLQSNSPKIEMDSTSIKSSTHYQILTQMQQHQIQQQQKQFLIHHHQQQQQQQQMKLQAEMMFRRSNSGINLKFDSPSSCTPTMSSTRSFISSLSMDGSVASLEGKPFHLIGAPQTSDWNSNQSSKKRCSGRGEDGSTKCTSSGRCHCSKRRKLRVKRSIKVPAISNKLADIPPDEFSWRKYGQKPIKGSPHPRMQMKSRRL